MSVEKRKDQPDFSDSTNELNPKPQNEPKNEIEIVVTQKEIDSEDAKKASEASGFAFDFGKISDMDYLYDIFSEEYDKFHSLDYLRKNREKLIEQGYPQTPTLAEYLFWTTISRRLQIIYNKSHQKIMETADSTTSATVIANTKFLENIQKVTSHITSLQKTIDQSLLATRQVKDVVDLHRETCEKAEKYLKVHFGEYIKKDSTKGKITDIVDKAYWAFIHDVVQTNLGNETVNYVWSEELRFLFDKKMIPLEFMAFTLRTSIEGLYNIAHIRNNKLVEIDREKAEKELKELMLEFEVLRDVRDREL